MYKRSVRRAYFGASPHLWPFSAWRLLVTWASIGILAALLAAYVGGVDDLNPIGASFVTVIATFWIAFLLLIPAAVITLFDVVLIRRPKYRPRKFDPGPRRADLQSLAGWAGYGAGFGSVLGAMYLFVYLNAFAPDRSYVRLIEANLLRFAVGGVGAGLVVAHALNVIHHWTPARTTAEQMRRGAFLWLAAVSGFSLVLFTFSDPVLERTILPGAVLAVIGAAVIPQLAVTPPTDVSQIPPPQLAAPLPPPPIPGPAGSSSTRPNPDSIETLPTAPPPGPRTAMEGGSTRGESSRVPSRMDRSDKRGAIQEGARGRMAASASTRSNPDSIETLPTAPSPGPSVPEGGAGEGARGDRRTAPPPQFPTAAQAAQSSSIKT